MIDWLFWPRHVLVTGAIAAALAAPITGDLKASAYCLMSCLACVLGALLMVPDP
jgi:hypothetical protein